MRPIERRTADEPSIRRALAGLCHRMARPLFAPERCGCPCHTSPKHAERTAPDLGQRLLNLANELESDGYDAGTEHSWGYTDGLNEAANRIREAVEDAR